LFNKRSVFLSLACALLLGAAVTAALMWRKAQHALEDGAKQAASASELPFKLVSLTPTAVPAGFWALGDRGGFESFALFEGQLLICNRSSLFRYATTGQLLQTWRVGVDLPPFPLLSLAVRHGIPQPELWIATEGGGALIWDGKLFRQFAPQDVPLRKLSALLCLPDGRMLLGTLNAGLYVTDTRQFSLFHAELKNIPVTALAGSLASDEVWIGTRTEGIWLWRAGTLTRFAADLPDPQVLSICAGESSVWVGTATGIAEFGDGRFRRRLAEGVFARALAEKAGKLWVATVDEGVLSIDFKAHTPRPSAGVKFAARTTFEAVGLMPVADSLLALGDSNVRRLSDGDDLLAPPTTGLTSGHITALTVDSQRRLWIGYFDRGVDVLGNTAGGPPQHFEDDVLFCINRVKQEPAGGRIFVATANGLALFDSGAQLRQVLRTSDGLIANHVTDVLFREAEPGMASTVVATSSGLSFLERGAVSSIYAFQGLVNNHVYTLAQAGPVLLAGTLGGVSVLRNGRVEASFTTANSELRQNWITSSAVSGGDVYLGGYGSGVVLMNSRFEMQAFREFAGKRVEINQNAMLATKSGIYAGTAGQGLAFLPSGQQRWHFWETGLPSANVTALASEGEDLYIGTDNGLIRLPERTFGI
jgi:ligand-binding sensor domain-containing protein